MGTLAWQVTKEQVMDKVVQCTLCELRFRNEQERLSHLELDHGERGEELAQDWERLKDEQRRNPKRVVLRRR
jgi:hypothetical protein